MSNIVIYVSRLPHAIPFIKHRLKNLLSFRNWSIHRPSHHLTLSSLKFNYIFIISRLNFIHTILGLNFSAFDNGNKKKRKNRMQNVFHPN